MILKKFEQLNDDEEIDDYLVDKFSLEDDSEYVGSYNMKNQIGFLFGAINPENVEIINNIKKYINSNFDLQTFKSGGFESDQVGVQVIFKLTDLKMKNLKNKIDLELNSKKYNL